MGETKTQRRTFAPLPVVRQRTGTGAWSVWSSFAPSQTPYQLTTSYRTGGERDDPLSASAIRDFSTVTYNGLSGQANPNYDTGHEFYTTKTWVRFSHPDWKVYRDTSGVRTYRKGPLAPSFTYLGSRANGFYPAEPRLSTSDLKKYGARAVSQTQPSKSSASLATFLGELLEAVPSMIGLSTLKSRGEYFKSSGSEYLNVQFGWAPFISDIRNIALAVKSANKTISQYTRDSGRVVRRRFAFPTENNSTMSGNIYRPGGPPIDGYVGDNPPWCDSSAPVYHEWIQSRDIWFSGAFQYYLNPGDGVLDRLDRYNALADRLLGTQLNPSVLWELAPWSWLVDWWMDIGETLANASAFSANGLVMKYGYLMCHTREFNRFTIPSGVTFNYGIKTGPIYSLWGRETKERRKATPYGFGIDPGSFSPFQWSILGALGLTRAPGLLH